MFISVIIPIYNEENRLPIYLPILAQTVLEYFDCNSFEILFVNDGSRDKTLDIIKKFINNNSAFRIVSYEINKGKGFAIKKGVESAKGNYIFFSDLDMSVDWKVFPEAFSQMVSGVDIVVTSRRLPKSIVVVPQKWYRIFFGWLYVFIANTILGTSYSDITCGFKGFTHKSAIVLFDNLVSERWSFDAEILYKAKKMKLRVKELPIVWKNDFNSKVSLSKDVLRSFIELVRIRLFDN